jgi:nitroreductase
MSARRPDPDGSTAVSLDAFVALARARRSISPRRLGNPAPALGEIRHFVEAAITAPDHGMLKPWRFLLIDDEYRTLLADAFACAEYELHPDAARGALARARDKALAGPRLVALVAVTRAGRPEVPVAEQLVSVGAALQNFLLAARAAGYDSMIVSGEKTATTALRIAFGLGANERLIGFIALGTVINAPPCKPRPSGDDHFAVWPHCLRAVEDG